MAEQRMWFRGYSIDGVTRRLFAPDGAAVALTGRAFDVLAYLVAHRERVVTRDELLEQVWEGRVVEENNLAQAIAVLRRAFGTDGNDHEFVLTVQGRGYRFVAPMDENRPVPAEGAVAEAGAAPARRRWPGLLAAAALTVAMVLVLAALRGRPTRPGAAPRAISPTLAVLPFRTIGASESDELLELGMAETLIARLSRSTNLRVLSLGSVQPFVGKDVDAVRTGMALGADYVVDGSTQRRGDALRINARLVSLPDGRAVWAATFDEPADRAFAAQDRLARSMSGALSLQYPDAVRHISPCDGADALAYRAYLRGKHLMFRPERTRLPKAIEAFDEAIGRDPRCARAWAGIAFAWRSLAMTADTDPRIAFPRARSAVDRALRIDPQSAEAHASKGVIEFWYDWDWKAAEASLRRAIALNDNLAEAHYALGHLLHNIGRNDEGLPHALRASQLDPLSPLINTIVASFLIPAGREDEAAVRLDGVLERDPDFWTALLWRSTLRARQGDLPGALADATRATDACRRCSHAMAGLAWLQVQAGNRDAAARLLAEMEQRDRQGYFPATRLALVHEALGHRTQALALLERAYAERDLYLTFLLVDPRLRAMHAEPRFAALQRRMGLERRGTSTAAAEQ